MARKVKVLQQWQVQFDFLTACQQIKFDEL